MSSLKKSVKINSPLPKDLAGECKKASKILNAFIAAKGIDNIIPPNILSRAKGLAIFTVIKAGFLFSGRAGSGVVVARLEDGTWSAPSAIGTGGMGFGGQIGAEITDFVIVLNTRSAVRSFMKEGNVTLGGNLSVAAGPIGRTAEAGASATVGAIAAIYSYSKTKGLFAGVSIEGSIIIERKDTNEAFYRAPVTAQELLSGAIPPPPQADILYRALNMKASNSNAQYNGNTGSPSSSFYGDEYQFSNGSNYGRSPMQSANFNRSASIAHTGRFGNSQEMPGNPSMGGRGRSSTNTSVGGYAFSSPSNSNAGGYVGLEKDNSAKEYRASTSTSLISDLNDPAPSYSPNASTPVSKFSNKPLEGLNTRHGTSRPSSDNNNPFASSVAQQNPMNTSIANNKSSSFSSSRSAPPPPVSPGSPAMGAKPVFVTALYDYTGEQPTDLSFSKGDRITVVKKTESTNDWWTGRLNGREGTFPANYVQ
ncbi:hypothetical protein BG015_004798 [Linnemannia schmuckeri]|uniref:SH3 domain-containing protein n=1 Tax=Linnemannia schmuckeri TaxID=64567 RepID=A0A9P5VCW8_9FUNG|nr:hypothetical protein BG015_004798 [Linnemannia schmuckeri]